LILHITARRDTRRHGRVLAADCDWRSTGCAHWLRLPRPVHCWGWRRVTADSSLVRSRGYAAASINRGICCWGRLRFGVGRVT